MQTVSFKGLGGILVLLTICGALATAADKPAERAMLKDGKMLIVQQGKTVPMENNVVLPHSIKVSTNATFTVNDGKPRKLKEGQVLDSEGMLTSPDGSVSIPSLSRTWPSFNFRGLPSFRSEEHTSELQSLTNIVC